MEEEKKGKKSDAAKYTLNANEALKNISIASVGSSGLQDQTNRLVSGVVNSAGVILAQDALRTALRLNDSLSAIGVNVGQQIKSAVSISPHFSNSAISLQTDIAKLNSISAINIPASLTGTIFPTSVGNNVGSMVASPINVPWTQSPNAITVIRDGLKELAIRLEDKMGEIITSKLDKLIDLGIIPSDIKSAECYCKNCGRLLFKVVEMSHFMKGTLRCQCGRTVQIPQDLRIEAIKD